jgi:hypothetical protein
MPTPGTSIEAPGRVAERLNAAVLKTVRRANLVSGVRIPPLPFISVLSAGVTPVLRARRHVTIWQVAVNPDGTLQYAHSGASVTRNGEGNYTVSWTGFPGTGLIYCTGIARNGTVTAESAGVEGGSATIDFGGVDTQFSCEIVGETG